MKICSKCWEEKPYEEFYKRDFTPDGYQYHCIVCVKEKRKEYYRKAKLRASEKVLSKEQKRKQVNKKINQIEKLISEIKAILD